MTPENPMDPIPKLVATSIDGRTALRVVRSNGNLQIGWGSASEPSPEEWGSFAIDNNVTRALDCLLRTQESDSDGLNSSTRIPHEDVTVAALEAMERLASAAKAFTATHAEFWPEYPEVMGEAIERLDSALNHLGKVDCGEETDGWQPVENPKLEELDPTREYRVLVGTTWYQVDYLCYLSRPWFVRFECGRLNLNRYLRSGCPLQVKGAVE